MRPPVQVFTVAGSMVENSKSVSSKPALAMPAEGTDACGNSCP